MKLIAKNARILAVKSCSPDIVINSGAINKEKERGFGLSEWRGGVIDPVTVEMKVLHPAGYKISV